MNNKNVLPKTTDDNGRDELGRFTHGNPGRPKGTGNKLKKAVSNYITEFLADKAEDLYTLYNELEPREQITLYIQLARLVLPRDTNEDKQGQDIRPIIVKVIPDELQENEE